MRGMQKDWTAAIGPLKDITDREAQDSLKRRLNDAVFGMTRNGMDEKKAQGILVREIDEHKDINAVLRKHRIFV